MQWERGGRRVSARTRRGKRTWEREEKEKRKVGKEEGIAYICCKGFFPKCQLPECQLQKCQLQKCQLLNSCTYLSDRLWYVLLRADQGVKVSSELHPKINRSIMCCFNNNLSDCSTYTKFEKVLWPWSLIDQQNPRPQLAPWIANLLRPRGRALLSGGYRYLRTRKESEEREFWQCCLWMCVARATTVGDQLEAVRVEYNNAFNSAKTRQKVGGCILPLQKKKYRQLHKGFGGSNVSRTSFNNLIPWCYWTHNWTLVTSISNINTCTYMLLMKSLKVDILGVDILGSWHSGSWHSGSWHSETNSLQALHAEVCAVYSKTSLIRAAWN